MRGVTPDVGRSDRRVRSCGSLRPSRPMRRCQPRVHDAGAASSDSSAASRARTAAVGRADASARHTSMSSSPHGACAQSASRSGSRPAIRAARRPSARRLRSRTTAGACDAGERRTRVRRDRGRYRPGRQTPLHDGDVRLDGNGEPVRPRGHQPGTEYPAQPGEFGPQGHRSHRLVLVHGAQQFVPGQALRMAGQQHQDLAVPPTEPEPSPMRPRATPRRGPARSAGAGRSPAVRGRAARGGTRRPARPPGRRPGCAGAPARPRR